ncbi:RidA family protein [Paenibacillus sp. H1-7]|uniref:RidA family protein n=1 Tax=Paenibacillus sp. H1-7 TaxID=2282849 RepID=UPI001EF78BEC|nr:RidA family protein [Paenibacillus sp. H1-7]
MHQSKQPVATQEASTMPFSSAIAAGGFLFVSGQGGLDPDTGRVVGPDLQAQTIQTLANIERILQEAGASLQDIVKVNVYLKERALYDEFNQVYRTYFSYPFPARTAVYSDLNYDILVEIDAIAILPKG